VVSKTIAVLGSSHMGQSALRIFLRHRPDDGFRVFDRDERALANAAALDPQRLRTRRADLFYDNLDLSGCAVLLNLAGAHGVEVLDRIQGMDTFTALAEAEHAFTDEIIATSAAAPAGAVQ
jgi:hypothetical protein